ncbi:type II toxin-antitoxin system VapB family antitoxin [Larkinella sp. VNQ87]|uniref:type II toxin-antitoxin system VapB family antitoxin n=1 Tax=Larkinella sp. VNQ87 TaxID=3400921 RepID=UPI003C02A67C
MGHFFDHDRSGATLARANWHQFSYFELPAGAVVNVQQMNCVGCLSLMTKSVTDSMKATIELNDEILQETMQLSHIHTPEDVIRTALYEFLRKLKKQELAAMRGVIQWEGDLDQMRTTPNE